ncbi:phosphotransferase family protein [Pseudobacter ginsenosidimutans]|uniref:Phosphotransferase family enzyme n=1 Tax=Pseudobacter ginsenosidimutans TaxID=661488 RepID=A0A4Q7N3M4_9BACT|nr:aminoglycoside phosphotransferase family protein [Pseudobacter ginsenosidimutans]QEC44068.1 aminoglycoside phosphotransferase family protein [Pseudobacter ginsenosidimutans]RZS75508.1 phosphotransferase family enzyme [Pseudobacter ginsenosidimutans]
MHFDTNTIQEFLETKYNYVHDVEPVADGWWSQALTFFSGEEKLVLRINQHPADFQKDVFAWEHFNSADLRVPEIKSTGNFNGNYFYCVSEFVDGIPSDRVLAADHLPLHLPLADIILNQLDLIHQLPTTQLQGWGYTGPNGNGLFESWEAFLLSIHNSKYAVSWQELAGKTWLNGPLFEKLLDKMKTWFPFLPKEKKVLHGDYGFDNLLLTPEGKVAAVIDWAEMMLGDPLYDLVHMCEPWIQRSGITYIDLWKKRKEEKPNEILNFEERLQCYNIHYTLFHMHIHTVRKEEKEYREVERWAMENL